jgi:hypothetical protein
MKSNFLNKLMLLNFNIKEIIKIKTNKYTYLDYVKKMNKIKEILYTLKDIFEIKLFDDNLYILINSSYDVIPEIEKFKKIHEQYFFCTIHDIDKINYFKDLNDIIHKNFINLSLQINKYLDKISCNVNLDKYKNIEEVIELNVIYKKVNKLLKLFNKKDITNNKVLTKETNSILSLYTQTHEMITFYKLSKNEIYDFDLIKNEFDNIEDVKLFLYKNILTKCKSIINLSSSFISNSVVKLNKFNK